MKDSSTHRKRHKSDSDSTKTGDRKSAGHKGEQKTEHGTDHKHDGKSQKGSGGHHGQDSKTRQRKVSTYQNPNIGHHGDHHDHGDHGDHGKPRERKISHARRISQHANPHITHHDDHHHFTRPRRDTMLSRGHSHYESDKRSTGTGELMTPHVHYENTYKLIPDAKIHEGRVREVIRAVLKENITETTYDFSISGSKCKLISEIIKERIKHLCMDRFKIVSMVMIGQESEQSMLVTSRCLWDHRFDNSISVEYKIGDIVALGMVFVVYAE